MYYYINLLKKKRIIEIKAGVLLRNAEIMHYMIIRGGMYRKPVNIVYFEFENMEI